MTSPVIEPAAGRAREGAATRVAQRARRTADRIASQYADDLSHRWQQGAPSPLVPQEDARPALDVERDRHLAVVCHVFYPELLDEVRRVAERLPARTDLYLSVVREQDHRIVSEALADWTAGEVVVRVVENRGRDIAPKYVGFADLYDRGYDLLLFLHTKKSTNEVVGPQWRRFLFDCLAGSPERVELVLGLFDEDPSLGVLAPEHYGPITPWIGWDGNYPHTRRVASRAGLKVRAWSPPDFPSGSMFWARPAALAPITRLGLQLEEFPPEAAQIQSTVMHALERLVYVGAAAEGFRSAVLAPDLVPNAPRGTGAARSSEPPAGRPPLALRAKALSAAVRRLR